MSTKKLRRKIEEELKKKQKELKIKYLNDACVTLHDAQQKNNGRIPHKMIHNIVQYSKETFPWITRDAVNKAFKNFQRDQQ